MPVYVTLVKSAAAAAKDLDVGEWFGRARKKAEETRRIKPIGAYALLGPYDMMFIYEAPDEKAAMSLSLSESPGLGVQSETWTAIRVEEFADLIAKLKR